MRRLLVLLITFLILLPSVYGAGFKEKVKEFTLSNGMKFLVYERHQVPTFAGMIMVKVGSVDERKGETGLAHFFEHMAFKGTPVIGTKDYEKEKVILEEMDRLGDEVAKEYLKGRDADKKKIEALRAKLREFQEEHRKYVVKDEMWQIYSENGGRFLNASTGNDTTQYFVMLPSNRLELWFLMESERFKYPALREFYSERDVVAEERRMWQDNDPDGLLWGEFFNVAYILHPYRHPVVGYMEDIQTFTKRKALNFYKTFYIPENMMAAIVGDVRFDEVKKLAEKYFGDIPRSPEPPRPEFLEPKQRGERRVIVKFDAEPRLRIGYHIPSFEEKDNVILELISLILSRGDSSRLVRDLVINKKLALGIFSSSNTPGIRYPALFMISGQSRHPHTPEELEKVIYEHIEKLKTEPVPKEEIEKAINQAEASLYRGLTSNIFLAMRLLWGALLFGDVDAEFKRVEEMKKVTPEEIMDVAKRIFVESNRTVGILHRKEKGGEK